MSRRPPSPHQSPPARGRGRGQGRGRGRGRPETSGAARAPSHDRGPVESFVAAPPPSYGRGESSRAPPPPWHGRGETSGAVPPPAQSAPAASITPGVAPDPVPASSSSVQVESLTSAVEKQLTLQSPAPSSTNAYRSPDRPGFGRVGRKIQVRANHFQVQVAELDLYHYDVAITPEITSKTVSREVISLLVDAHRENLLGNRLPAYDGRKSLFTAGPLPFESKEFMIKLGDDQQSSSSSATTARRKRERDFKVTIRLASTTDLHHLNQFLARLQLDCPQETIQALDVVLRASPSLKYDVVGRSFFSPAFGRPAPLGGGTEYWRGYYQSLRPTQMGLSLNIDVSATAFYEPIPVIDFILKNLRFNLNRPLSDQDRVKIKKALRGVKVEVNHGQNIRRYKVTGVTREPLRDLEFTLDDNRTKTSVVQYFGEKYNISLEYGALPALLAGSDTKPIYLPMELCQIMAGQRYTKKLNEEQVTALLRATCQRPRDRENSIKQVVKHCNFNTDKFARNFGIQVNEDPVLIDARVLPPPKLKYHDTGKEKGVEPRMGQWNMIDKKMVRGGTLQYWCCLNFSARVSRELPSEFCIQLADMCNSKGMVFNPEPLLPIIHSHPSQIDNILLNIDKQCKTTLTARKVQGRLQLLIIILPDIKGSYGKIKRICETELGIVSQCCQPQQAVKKNKQYLENVALKINVKVGGSNTVLDDAYFRRIPHVSDCPTLILGADVTHPQPGEDSSPSIAAVVASMDWPYITKYRGVVSAQTHREEIIQDLYTTHQAHGKETKPSGIIRELLIAHRRSTGQKPARIIFYRDGVSEGQFSQVLLYEMDAIRRACCSLEEGYLPRVTFVVVQKRHHTRLFPRDHGGRDTDRSHNIMPGTVVDTTICHPREFDFYLNSHAGIQGTSRPTHYHVLFDENNFTADELQTFTNNLCYTYARCTRSVSIVPPAYYAHLAAFRARYYIEGSDAGSGGGNRAVNFEVMENVKEVMFFC